MAKGKQPSIQKGQTFTDKNGDEVVVTNYVSATKVEVQWGSGEKQYKSAQQLRMGNFSQRTRKTKGNDTKSVEQPYKQYDNTSEDTTEVTGDMGMYHSPSLFQD